MESSAGKVTSPWWSITMFHKKLDGMMMRAVISFFAAMLGSFKGIPKPEGSNSMAIVIRLFLKNKNNLISKQKNKV